MSVITFVCAGQMNSAITFPAFENGHEVRLVGSPLDRDIIDGLKKDNFHITLKRTLHDGIKYYQIEELEEALKGADAKNTDGGWKDGTYEGEGQGFGGKVVVEVTIENGEITCIEVKEAQKEDSAYLEMAKDIIEDIVDAQSADVDTISGATFSSTGIREAVTQALEKAE